MAAGFSTVSGSFDFALVRYLSNGDRDSGFGVGGMVVIDFAAGGDDSVSKVALQRDGKIVAAGGAAGSAGTDFALARFREDGSLDDEFGKGGLVRTDFNGNESATSVAITQDGKSVAAGITDARGTFDFAVARYQR